MSEKLKWAGVYLFIAAVPLLFYILPAPNPKIFSFTAISKSLVFAPTVGLILIAILGWKVNQTRIFWSASLLLALYLYFLHTIQTGNVEILQILSVTVPAALSIIFALKESRLWSDLSLARFLLALSPFVLFVCLFSFAPEPYQNFLFWGPVTLKQSLFWPPLSWVAVGLFLLVANYLYDPKVKFFLVALAASLVPFLFSVYILLNANLAHPNNFCLILSFTAITVILLHALLRMYWQKVYLDPLTAISNRQALDERLHTLSGDFSLAMVDIDHFKKFNDTYGHAEGDNVLRMMAQHLEEHLGDAVYRYGGEEFCAIFEKEGAQKALETMEKTRAALEKRKFTLRGNRQPGYSGLQLPFHKREGRGKKVHITISVGVASTTRTHKTAEEVIKRADHALYEAKEKGRNRVVSADK